jgi:hypothetical protein
MEDKHTECPNCGEYLQKPWTRSAILEHDPLRVLGLPTTCTLIARAKGENDERLA